MTTGISIRDRCSEEKSEPTYDDVIEVSAVKKCTIDAVSEHRSLREQFSVLKPQLKPVQK
jgi:hypothetical protein